MSKILVTGAAGFIGSALSIRLLERGDEVVGFGHILEGCCHNNVEYLVYASSSSVYGSNTKMPFSVHDNVNHPVSLYAATKKANELMAHTYSHLYDLPHPIPIGVETTQTLPPAGPHGASTTSATTTRWS